MGEDRSCDRGAHLAFVTECDRSSLRNVSPRKSAVQARSRALVEAVLEAAARLFEERGFVSVTTDEIAARAGVSIGSLYQYFPNKDAIAVALMERHGQAGVDDLVAVFERLRDETPPLEQGLRWLVEAVVEPHLERPALHDALADGANVPPAFRIRKRRLTRAMAPLLADYLARVRPGLADTRTRAMVLAASLEALTHALTAERVALIDVPDPVAEIHAMLLGYARAGERESSAS